MSFGIVLSPGGDFPSLSFICNVVAFFFFGKIYMYISLRLVDLPGARPQI